MRSWIFFLFIFAFGCAPLRVNSQDEPVLNRSPECKTNQDIVVGQALEVIRSRAVLRKAPKTQASVLSALPVGTLVVVLEVGCHWLKVSTNTRWKPEYETGPQIEDDATKGYAPASFFGPVKPH